MTGEFVADVIRAIKAETGLAITLSLGERSDDGPSGVEGGRRRPVPAALRDVRPGPLPPHPPEPARAPCRTGSRSCCGCASIGYEIGTGVMVGIPGQTWDTLASDIGTFRDLDMDMIGIGPYLPSPRTPLAGPLGTS